MRKFIATCCCLIVGLQVLIGVPLVICVVFFAYASAASGPVFVTQAPVPSDMPLYPPPLPVAPPRAMPMEVPLSPYRPSSAPPSPAVEPPKMPPSNAGQPVSFPPTSSLPMPFASPAPTLSLSPTPAPDLEPAKEKAEDKPLAPSDVAEIVVARQQVGSSLEGTLLEKGEHETAFVNALADTDPEAGAEQPAEREEETTGNPTSPTRYEIISDDGSTTFIVSEAPPQTDPLVETLGLAIKQLYSHADWHEQACSWQRADEVRELARSLARHRAVLQSLRPLAADPRGVSYYGEPAAEPKAAATESD